MPAPRYTDAVRRQPSSQSKEASLSQRRVAMGRGNGGSQTTPVATVGQKPTPLPHDPRFVFTFAAAMNRRVTVQVKSGLEFEGTLHGPVLGSKNIHITLKNAKRVEPEGTMKPQMHETLVIPANEFVQMKACAVPFPSQGKHHDGHQTTQSLNEEGSKTGSEYMDEKEYEVLPVKDENDMSGFMGDIERANAPGQPMLGEGRVLVPWNGGDVEQEDLSLESTFDMDVYTSKLDVSQSRYTEEEAARIANEIESAPRELPAATADDSGVLDEEVPHPTKMESTPRKKPFSWADAVKGKSTPRPGSGRQTPKQTAAEQLRRTPEKKDAGGPYRAPAYQTTTRSFSPGAEVAPNHPLASTPACDDPQIYPDNLAARQNSFSCDTAETAFLPPPDSATPSSFLPGREQKVMFGSVAYPLSSCVESPTVGERPGGFRVAETNMSIDKTPAQYLRDPVWGPPGNGAIGVETLGAIAEPEPLDQGIRELPPEDHVITSPVVQKSEMKKTTSIVKPGISFKDKLKANLPSPSPKTSALSKQRPAFSGHGQTKSTSNIVDPTMDPVVRSPRSNSFSGKLISNPRKSDPHHADATRRLPSEEHLLSPMTMAHPMMYPPPHEMGPPSMGAMPPMVHAGYPEMPHAGPHPSRPYGDFGPPQGPGRIMPPDGVPMMAPPAHYPVQGHISFSSEPERADQEDGDIDAAARRRGTFQLNPMAPAFKPVASFEGAPPGPEPHSPAPYKTPPPEEYEIRTPHGEAPLVQAPPSGPAQPPVPKHPMGPVEGHPPHPGARPFMPPSNVVTPWPSFPGTGVWHSTLGPPRPGTPSANAMMNGFMPPGMPGPYPMYMPGVGPAPYVGGMQDPMWRPPPMPPGMQDQQRIAMMWSNYYNQLVPPNKRMWNSSKFAGVAGPMPRPGRNYRRPPTGHNTPPAPNFSPQAPNTQPSGEML